MCACCSTKRIVQTGEVAMILMGTNCIHQNRMSLSYFPNVILWCFAEIMRSLPNFIQLLK